MSDPAKEKDTKAKAAAADDDEGWEDAPDENEDGEEEQAEEEEEEEDHTLENPLVVERWKAAGRLAQTALRELIAKCVSGASPYQLGQETDTRIAALIEGTFKKESKRAARQVRHALTAIGFPTCVSVNTIVCHHAAESDDGTKLEDGDIVRLDLGVSVLGHLASAAHTLVVGGVEKLSAVLHAKASAVFAAAAACEAIATRLLRPANTNDMVTDAVARVCEAYGVMPVEGVISHRIEWDDVEGSAAIILRKVASDPPQRVDTCTFAVGEAWTLDVVVTSGAGRLREGHQRPTVFRRTPNRESMRVRASREVLYRVNRNSGNFPFSLRQVADVKAARFGVMECVKSSMLLPYPILFERAGEVVAHLKSTVLILPKEIVTIAAGPPLALADTPPERPLPKEIVELRQRGLLLVARKKRKKAGGGGGGGGGKADEDEEPAAASAPAAAAAAAAPGDPTKPPA